MLIGIESRGTGVGVGVGELDQSQFILSEQASRSYLGKRSRLVKIETTVSMGRSLWNHGSIEQYFIGLECKNIP